MPFYTSFKRASMNKSRMRVLPGSLTRRVRVCSSKQKFRCIAKTLLDMTNGASTLLDMTSGASKRFWDLARERLSRQGREEEMSESTSPLAPFSNVCRLQELQTGQIPSPKEKQKDVKMTRRGSIALRLQRHHPSEFFKSLRQGQQLVESDREQQRQLDGFFGRVTSVRGQKGREGATYHVEGGTPHTKMWLKKREPGWVRAGKSWLWWRFFAFWVLTLLHNPAFMRVRRMLLLHSARGSGKFAIDLELYMETAASLRP